MANAAYTATAGISVAGLTPATGPKPTVTVNAPFNSGSTSVDDYYSDTFTINANTPATLIDIGKIASGLLVAIQTTGSLLVTLTQDQGAGPAPTTIKVDTYLMLESGFTAIEVANTSQTTAVEMSITVLGNRVAVGTGPGVF